MAATSVNRLRLTKQTLLLESELNRLTLAEDLARIQRHVPWPIRGAEGAGSSAWLRLLPLAGSFAAGGFVGKRPWLRRIVMVLQLAAAVYPLWRKFNAPDEPTESAAPAKD